MKNAIVAPAALLLLTACQPQAPDGNPAPPPADAPSVGVAGSATLPAPPVTLDLSRPITARGTEPFWSLTIDGKALRLTRLGQPDITAEAPGAAVADGRATWIARTEAGQQITVTLYASECSDGMSDLTYPLTAEVTLLNEALRGCAAKTAELPREGPPAR